MSKASQLGAGRFGQTQQISARRAAINATTAAPTEGAPLPVRLPVTAISLNPDNPRSELGDLSSLAASLRDHGQKTAISIMGRVAYLAGNPDRENDLEPGTKYVAIDGNSRLAAAREAGLAEIKVMVDDDLGSNPDELLESALVANVHRQDLDPLDEAHALNQLLKVHRTQEALANRLHRSQGWVSQRLSLLSLTPELQDKLKSGEEPAALLRRVGKKKPAEQNAHLEKLKRQESQNKTARSSTTTAAPEQSPAPPAPVEQSPPSEPKAPTEGGPDYYAVINGGGDTPDGGEDVPTQRSAELVRLPSHDPETLVGYILAELDVEAWRKVTELLVDRKIAESKRAKGLA
ncbi:ParB/RepB/Spo0J family partition protein [Streptomyces sp. NPDC005576]|uniref:ParB/RepB/Spo0J family partition protein n=1 Tax=unclassified Streptomyces TaxID=2593676 RepID=UPI003405CD10